MASVQDFESKIKAIIRALPRLLGNETVKFFQSQMDKQEDVHGKRYAKRSYETDLQRDKRVLSDRGNLYDAIEILSIDADSVVVGVDENIIVYAGIHNDGGQIIVSTRMKRFFWAKHREATKRDLEDDADFYKAMALKRTGSAIDVPKREFVGDSSLLRAHLEREVQLFVDGQLSTL